MQLNQKMPQAGKEHPDRDKQFHFINNKAKRFLKAGVPVISIDAKKKKNIGNFLQQLAEQSGLEIHVPHSPPGTSKWNKVERRMFCCITAVGRAGH